MDPTRDWEGDYEGSCRKCWKVRTMGVGWRPTPNEKVRRCNRTNPDGSICDGTLLVALTPDAKKRVNAARRQKKATEFNRAK